VNAGEVSDSPGGETAPLAVRTLSAPLGDPPRVIYRDVRYVRLVTGGVAESLVFDAGATALSGSMASYDFDALEVAEPSLRAAKSSLGGGVVLVEMAVPRHVRWVRIASAKASTTGYTLEIYRVDGEAVSAEPTASFTTGELIAHVTTSEHAVVAGGAVVVGAMEGLTAQQIEIEHELHVLSETRAFGFDFTDARFALRLKAPGGSYVTDLAPAHVEQVSVRSYPSTPRLAVAFPEDPESPVGDPASATPVWQAAGEIGGAVPATAGEFAAGAALAEVLARGAGRLADAVRATASAELPVPVLPEAIDVALVIESDAPCRFVPEEFELEYRLATASFPGGAEKETVRFTGGGPGAPALAVRLPVGATISSATLLASPSLRANRPGAGAIAALSAPPTSRAGARIGGSRHAAQAIQLPGALEATGFAVAVLPLAEETELRAALLEDANDSPVGRVLAESVLACGPAGRAAWLTWQFDGPLVISTARHWLRLTAAAGEGVWLSAPGSGPAHLRADDGATLAVLADRDLLAHPLTAGAGAGGAEPGAPGDDAPRLRAGAATVTATVIADGRLEYDLATALTAALADQSGETVAEIPLSFASATSGSLTAYPPRIEFELAAD